MLFFILLICGCLSCSLQGHAISPDVSEIRCCVVDIYPLVILSYLLILIISIDLGMDKSPNWLQQGLTLNATINSK